MSAIRQRTLRSAHLYLVTGKGAIITAFLVLDFRMSTGLRDFALAIEEFDHFQSTSKCLSMEYAAQSLHFELPNFRYSLRSRISQK